MERSHRGANGQHHTTNNPDDTFDNDSSTAMSLDESSIQLNATAASHNISVDMTGTSFSRRGGGSYGGGRRSNASAGLLTSPAFSPFGGADDSTAMSISGMDNTPSSHQMMRGNVNGGQHNSNDNFGPNKSSSDIHVSSLGGKPPLNFNAQLGNNGKKMLHGKTDEPSSATNTTTATRWNNSDWDLNQARSQLRRASRECSRRGLKLASRWASEQLMGLASSSFSSSSADDNLSLLPEERCQPNDVELYAISLFDLGEYSRAAHVLSSSSTSNESSSFSDGSLGQIKPPRDDLTSLGVYLRAFSLYLDGERRKEEQVTELRDPLERTKLLNSNLPQLEADLRRSNELGELDAFGLYVYGVVLKELRGAKRAPSSGERHKTNNEFNQTADARTDESVGDAAHVILIRSILKYPFNWSAWLDLGELCVDDSSIDQEVEELLLPISDHWMYHFFCVHVFIEEKANENAIAIIEKLANGKMSENEGQQQGFFIQSAYLQSQLAMAYYDIRDYDSAQDHFLALAEREPYRLDNMDAFSNVLYVKDQKVALSHLAHRSVTVDKYRPETCIIVGNYYSSKGRHEKAVQYFQRALKLDRSYLSAWTLLGHEYIEMKNTAAAIEAYRRAVDISDREYRAWYGLGQTYEIMNMLLHALFYFRKAAALHPHDARMWCAIGGCLLGLDRRSDAEKSYERAVSLGDGEGIATRKLAELYREDGDEEKAAKCYLRHLELRYQSQLAVPLTGGSADSSPEAFENVVNHVRVDEPEAEALLYLAYYYRDNLEYDAAILCATRLEDYPGPEKEQGKGLLRDIRSRMDHKVGQRRYKRRSKSPKTPGRGVNSSMDSTSEANAESSFEFSP
ncbi:anaphase-promoting complex subunit 8 [Skeletonema marinoi]|uniref:Anaphase-promoting complex subunit 8 n=1 Tax=Skeletonema marinoi TaxID=267567 RepID=A0AAD8Y8R1_9STRA|nr:anaphase-promoting complex subunit 8 [Skeletonema marinoi]